MMFAPPKINLDEPDEDTIDAVLCQPSACVSHSRLALPGVGIMRLDIKDFTRSYFQSPLL
jgi:hypothetical protein